MLSDGCHGVVDEGRVLEDVLVVTSLTQPERYQNNDTIVSRAISFVSSYTYKVLLNSLVFFGALSDGLLTTRVTEYASWSQ